MKCVYCGNAGGSITVSGGANVKMDGDVKISCLICGGKLDAQRIIDEKKTEDEENRKMETEEYGKIIFMSKESEEKVSQMTDLEIDILSMQIAEGLRRSHEKLSRMDYTDTPEICS